MLLFKGDDFLQNIEASSHDKLYIIKGDVGHLNLIYSYYKKDFPSKERKDYFFLKSSIEHGLYKLLLLKHPHINDILGYSLIYDLTNLNALWLDYIAINANFRGMGYGSYFFQQILKEFNSQTSGMFMEVEIPNRADELNFLKQKRRIQFYEKLGAKRLNMKYLFPSSEGDFPMYLYFKTNSKLNSLPGSLIKQILVSVFKSLHSDVTESHLILKQNLANTDEQITLY